MSKQRKTNSSKKVASRPAIHEAVDTVSDDIRHTTIAEAAYLLAEQRGFVGGMELDDWLRAEKKFNARLSASE